MKLPDSWIEARLQDVCLLNPKLEIEERPEEDIQVTFVPMSAVDENVGVIAKPEIRNYSEVAKGYTNFKEGDVLFAKVTPCMENGKAAIVGPLLNGLGFGSTEFHVLRPTDEVLPEYLFHFIRQPAFRTRAASAFVGTGGLQRVPLDFLSRVKLPLPTLPEQQRMVDVLRLLDDMITARNTQISRLHSLIFLLFAEYFQAPEVSRGNEKNGLLADLAWINPPLDSPIDLQQEVSFLPMAAIDEVSGRIAKYETKFFQEVKAGYTRFVENDVLFAKISPCMENGKIAIAQGLKNGIGVGSTEFHVFRPKPNATAEFLWALTRRTVFRKMAARAFIGTSGHQRVPESFLKTYKLRIPTFEKQLAFSENVRNIFQELERQENQQFLLKKSSQALVISAFNGELTEAWRAAHIKEITTSTIERDESLRERGSKFAQSYAESKSTPTLQKDLDRPARHWLLNEISEFQGAVWTMLCHEWPQKLVVVDDPEAFNDFCTNEQTTWPIKHFNASPNRVRRTLEQLAALGLIAKVSVPRQNAATQQTEYLTAFRPLREAENSRLRDAAMLNNELNPSEKSGDKSNIRGSW
jgi:type I restriction enzyme, S subunit